MVQNSTSSTSSLSSKKFLIVIIVLISTLVVDTAITKTAVFVSSELLSDWRMIVFGIVVSSYIVSQHFVLRFVRLKSREIKTSEDLHLDSLYRVTQVTQYALIAILLLIAFQIMINQYYNTILLIVGVLVSYGLAFTMLFMLAQRFFLWFRSNFNSVIFSYGLASALLATNVIISLIFAVMILQDKPEKIIARIGIQIPISEFGSGSMKDTLNQLFLGSSITSFAMLWTATVLLLRHHERKLGNIKFWSVVPIPLAYFLSQFLAFFFGVANPIVGLSPVLVSVILILAFWLSKPVGGILFGIVFWRMSRSVSNDSVKDYLTISAYGLVLLFVSHQAVAIVASPSYPAFGFATIAFVGLSSYLLLVGIYSSAISVSHDLKLRNSIRRVTMNELKLLDSISTAEWEERVEGEVKKVIRTNQDAMFEETGIQSSLTEDEVKNYLDDVLKEIKRKTS